MSNWKILICDGLAENGQAILREAAEVDDHTGIAAEELLKVVGDYDVMIVRSRTKVRTAVFQAAARLQVVGRAGVGVDNIDLDAAQSHGVTVVNSPTATAIAVAELALGLMLTLARHIARADATMKTGQWAKKQLRGSELYHKTLGIIGVGRIGSELARRASALGMTVIGHDPLITGEAIRERGVEPVDLDGLYGRSDYISLHVPLTPDTKGMINRESFTQMKSGVRLVCTARGGVVDEEELLAALQSGQVAGAALDVFAQEPPGDSPLAAHPNVVATPHIGAQTNEAQARAAAHIAAEVLAALRGEELRWRVV